MMQVLECLRYRHCTTEDRKEAREEKTKHNTTLMVDPTDLIQGSKLLEAPFQNGRRRRGPLITPLRIQLVEPRWRRLSCPRLHPEFSSTNFLSLSLSQNSISNPKAVRLHACFRLDLTYVATKLRKDTQKTSSLASSLARSLCSMAHRHSVRVSLGGRATPTTSLGFLPRILVVPFLRVRTERESSESVL